MPDSKRPSTLCIFVLVVLSYLFGSAFSTLFDRQVAVPLPPPAEERPPTVAEVK